MWLGGTGLASTRIVMHLAPYVGSAPHAGRGGGATMECPDAE